MSNIVKETAKELGMTYKQLGDAIGYTEGALKAASSSGKTSDQMAIAIKLYAENVFLKREKKEDLEFKERLNGLLREFNI